jgi:hypothetical protein
MKLFTFNKFNKYILLPDVSYKLMAPSYRAINTIHHFTVYLKYILSNRKQYTYLPLKSVLMLETIYPKKAQLTSKLIVLKYTRTRAQCTIFLKLRGRTAFAYLMYGSLKPIKMSTTIHGLINETKHFVLPSFINILKFPLFSPLVNLSFVGVKAVKMSAVIIKFALLD